MGAAVLGLLGDDDREQLVVLGGVLLLIDGALGLWSLTFGGAKTGNFWFDVVRNVLAIVTGVLILIMPRLLNYIVAIYLIIIGAIGLFGK